MSDAIRKMRQFVEGMAFDATYETVKHSADEEVRSTVKGARNRGSAHDGECPEVCCRKAA
jgi:hypothetical protein